MKKLVFSVIVVAIMAMSSVAANFKVDSYKLDNGLTIILNEDHSQTKVYGAVTVNAGAVNDPEDATGLAHYLEHVLFNGTNNVGTINWEEEKVHYNKIIELFEELKATEDEESRAGIIKQINEESLAQGKYFQTKEFVLLLESIGASGINAGTSYDYTFFHSMFPPSQSANWLEIYANEFTNPVFRNFQAELETVYEEYNMSAEDPFGSFTDAAFQKMWEGTPYGKHILGYSDHLKSPSLKSLIEFYDTWYVPENMALILVGDFDKETIKGQIENTFGKLKSKSLPENVTIEKAELKEKAKIRLKQTPYNVGLWCFNAPYKSDEDVIKMQLLSDVLSNSASIGVLDQLQTDGDVMYITSMYLPLNSASIFAIQAIPNFDMSQMRQLSPSDIDNLIFKKLEAIKEGELDEKFLNSVKDNFIRNFSLQMENFTGRGQWIMEFFTTGKDVSDVNAYLDMVSAITVEDIVEIANKYLTKTFLEVTSSKGSIKLEEIEKPELEPVVQTVEEPSEFAKMMQPKMDIGVEGIDYINFDEDIQRDVLADKVKLYYKQNNQNDIFNLIIKYKVGTSTIPTLDFAAQLMNNAGVRGNYEPYELKKKMGELGCTYRFAANENNLIVTVSGLDKNLEEACKLISMITLMPDLDDKQYNSLIGGEINGRMVQRQNFQNLATAATQYLIYGENSPYIDRLSAEELNEISINSLTGNFISATQYEANVHFISSSPFEEAKTRLQQSLVFASGRMAAPELFVRDVNKPEETMIYFVNKSGTRQSKISVMVPVLDEYSIEQEAAVEAYSKYFGEGLGNIFFQEIREYRSMAYSARASVYTPSVQGKPAFLVGNVSTQGDKTNDAVETILSLLNDMPLKPYKAEGVKNNLVYGSVTSRPSDRYLTQYVEIWEQLGYTEDPLKVNEANYKEADIDMIKQFYDDNVKVKPMAIVIVGDKKKVDTKALAKLGTYKSLSTSKLFNE